jgi:hypothetical protein
MSLASRLSAAFAVLALAASGAYAQSGAPSPNGLSAQGVRGAPSPNGLSGAAAPPGAPSPNGLSSPFQPQLPSLAVPGTSATGTVEPDNAGLDPANYPDTAVMGAGPYGSRGLTRPGTGPYSNVDIARSFIQADANRDGELTRVEATRLAILPITFEEMDANHNDILTRSEYEDAVR